MMKLCSAVCLVTVTLALGVPAATAGSDPVTQAPPTSAGFYTNPAPVSVPLPVVTFDPTEPPSTTPDTAVNQDIFHPPSPYPTAQCRDGLFSYSSTASSTCVGYGGVLDWIYAPGTAGTITVNTAPRMTSVGAELGNNSRSFDVVVTSQGAICDAASSNQFNRPNGRWVVIDWQITNDGSENVNVNPFDFVVQTTDGFIIEPGNGAGLPEPQLDLTTLGQGETARGYVVYDVPRNAKIRSLIYQPPGQKQFIIAGVNC